MVPPILFLIFSRPDTTTRVFEAIRAARPARLYVAADGPRPSRPGEAERCAEVRRIATSVDWPCEIMTLFREENVGCRAAVSGAITWFFAHEEEGIILEDDCLPHPDFFPWCTAMLDRYRDEPRIMCITGNNFQTDMQDWPYSYYYSIYNHCWGWAGWRRAWDLYDPELPRFEAESARQVISRLSRAKDFAATFIQNIDQARRGLIDTWDYQWTWTCWANDGLTCTPRFNLVSNIGFGPDATHTHDTSSSLAEIPTSRLSPPYIAPPRIAPEARFDENVTRSNFAIGGPSFLDRAIAKLKRIFVPTT